MRLNYLKKNRLRMNNVLCPLSAYPLIETEMPIEGDTTYLPTANDIPMIFQNPDGEPPFHRDVKVFPRNEETPLINLNILSTNLDPMTYRYAIFFPFGEPGWQPMMESNDRQGTNLRRRKLTMLQYKISKTAIKDGEINELLHGRELFQQWIVESSLQF